MLQAVRTLVPGFAMARFISFHWRGTLQNGRSHTVMSHNQSHHFRLTYWDEPERAPPSGVAGWNVCLYRTWCRKSLVLLLCVFLRHVIHKKWRHVHDPTSYRPRLCCSLWFVAWLTVPVLKSLSKGTSTKYSQNASSVHAVSSRCILHHTMCLATDMSIVPVHGLAEHIHVTVCDVPGGLLHWLTVPVFVLLVYHSVAWSLSHIWMTVVFMQLLSVFYVYSLRFAPQCHAFL